MDVVVETPAVIEFDATVGRQTGHGTLLTGRESTLQVLDSPAGLLQLTESGAVVLRSTIDLAPMQEVPVPERIVMLRHGDADQTLLYGYSGAVFTWTADSGVHAVDWSLDGPPEWIGDVDGVETALVRLQDDLAIQPTRGGRARQLRLTPSAVHQMSYYGSGGLRSGRRRPLHAQPHNQAVRDAIWTGRELLLLSGANNLFVVQPKRGRLRYFDYAGPAAGIVATERGLLAFGGEPMTRRTGVHPFGKQWAWITPAGVDVDWSDPDYVVVAAHGAAGDVLALDADGALRSEPHGSSTVWEPALALPEDGHWLDFLSVHDEIVAWGPNRLVLVRTDGTQTERQVVVAPTAPPSALPPGPDVELVGLERHAHGFVLPTSDPLTKPLRRHYRYFVASVPGSEAAWVDWRRNDLLMRWTDDTHTRLEPTPFDNARDADALADQTLLVVADDGVWRFDVEQDHATHMVVDDSPTSVAVDGCGRAWMAGRTLWQLTDSTWTPVETVPPVPDGLWTPFAATPTGIRTRNLEITVPCESAPEAAP